MMDTKSYIFWFSGTGNSLYAAKKLSDGIGGIPLYPITDNVPSGVFGGDGAKIGFVFPSYYSNLPRIVKNFIEKLQIGPETYIFTIVTMASIGHGSVGALEKALKAKGARLNYGRGIHMPANYIFKYNPANGDNKAKKLEKADARLGKFANDISAGVQLIKTIPVVANSLYKNIERLDAGFFANEKCTGCGMCERLCPVHNIKMADKKPEWLHKCEHCVACISWCPAKAIEYGNITQNRRRYRNPHVKMDELVRKG